MPKTIPAPRGRDPTFYQKKQIAKCAAAQPTIGQFSQLLNAGKGANGDSVFSLYYLVSYVHLKLPVVKGLPEEVLDEECLKNTNATSNRHFTSANQVKT
jgi:hypothetical protein